MEDHESINPYAAPPVRSEEDDSSDEGELLAASRYKLYSVGAVMLATFLGSPVAGCVLLAINYWRVGRKSAAWTIAVAGLFASMGVFAAAAVLPEDVPNMLFVLIQLLAMYFAATGLQQTLISQHRRDGGRMASKWAAAGISILVVAGVGALFVVGLVLIELGELGSHYEVTPNEEIYYSGDADRDDARRLARCLQEEEYFDDSSEATVLMSESDGETTISFVVTEDAWDDPSVVEYYEELGGQVADDGFGRPLVVELLDDEMELQKTVVIR